MPFVTAAAAVAAAVEPRPKATPSTKEGGGLLLLGILLHCAASIARGAPVMREGSWARRGEERENQDEDKDKVRNKETDNDEDKDKHTNKDEDNEL